ncbi:MAG: hypothetical protein IKQ29_03685 [Bacilli bacterium]|nr:hypothetical protein [Bacilli bacterium]
MRAWDCKFLLEKKNSLINRYNISRNDHERYQISQMIASIESAMEYITPSNTDTEEYYFCLLQSLYDDKDIYRRFSDFLGDITNFYTGFYYDMPLEPTPFQEVDTSKNKVITVTRDFFSRIKGNFGSRLLNNERNGNLRVRFERTRPDDFYEGQTFPLYGTDMTLVSVNLNKNIVDYINLIHEYGHVLNHSFYRYQMFDNNKYPLQEVAPIFFELVAGDYLTSMGFNVRELNKSYVHMFRDAVTAAGVDTIRFDLIRNRKKFDNDEEIIAYLHREFNDNVLIDFAAENVISDNLHYVFSYLIAVELYMLYKTNHEEALNKLVRIMKVNGLKPNQYYNFIIDLGITPLESMGAYLDSINRKQIHYGR